MKVRCLYDFMIVAASTCAQPFRGFPMERETILEVRGGISRSSLKNDAPSRKNCAGNIIFRYCALKFEFKMIIEVVRKMSVVRLSVVWSTVLLSNSRQLSSTLNPSSIGAC